MQKIILYIVLLITVLSCNDDSIDTKSIPYEPKIVVEGAIESGDYPRVTLSVSASITGPFDTLSLLNHVIKHAKVTVSDGVESEVLSLVTNNNKIPPYEYRGLKMKGEVGKAYSLLVEMEDRKITGETFIPKPVELDSIWVKKNFPQDTIAYIFVRFRNESEHCYQISTRVVGKEKIYTPCLYGNINNTTYDVGRQIDWQVNKGPVIFPESSYNTYFISPSTVSLKFSTQPKDCFQFWTSYQNELLNSQNPIFPAHNSLKSNIKGGIGIWAGYGVTEYLVDL